MVKEAKFKLKSTGKIVLSISTRSGQPLPADLLFVADGTVLEMENAE